ncbi:MAG: HIT family protein [Planctomycetes bacterium]|nr:HIT family protein [Planctomycetota bacterium]
MPSIFTRIIRHEIPARFVMEEADVVAFLDIAPLSRGHVLVVPVEEREFLHQLSPASAEALGRALQRVAAAVVDVTGTRDYNILQNNGAAAHQAVPHVHFHVIPKHADGAGLGIQWRSGALDAADATMLADAIRDRLGK